MATNETYQKSLQDNKGELLIIGSMVSSALSRSIEALKKRDLALAHQIIAEESRVKDKRFEIENKCIQFVTNQKPPEADLRIIVAILNIATELERIGDYAEGIAKIVIMIGDEPPLKPLIDIPRMADIIIEMIRDSLKSFIESDTKMAMHVISMDDVIDSIYDQVFRELLTFMMEDPKTINRATRLIWVAHNLERAADRATNICDRAVYTITGKGIRASYY